MFRLPVRARQAQIEKTYDRQAGFCDDLWQLDGDVREHVVVLRVRGLRGVEVESRTWSVQTITSVPGIVN